MLQYSLQASNQNLGITGDGFAHRMYRAGTGASINSVVYGNSFADNLRSSYTNALVDYGAKWGANQIGDGRASGALNSFEQKFAHAALGCLSASAKGQDCNSGAMGGMAGEIFAELTGDNTNLSDEAILNYARIATGFAAQAGGHDVNTADGTASNAITNNYLTHKTAMERKRLRDRCNSGECSKEDLNRVKALNRADREIDEKIKEISEKCSGLEMCGEVADLL